MIQANKKTAFLAFAGLLAVALLVAGSLFGGQLLAQGGATPEGVLPLRLKPTHAGAGMDTTGLIGDYCKSGAYVNASGTPTPQGSASHVQITCQEQSTGNPPNAAQEARFAIGLGGPGLVSQGFEERLLADVEDRTRVIGYEGEHEWADATNTGIRFAFITNNAGISGGYAGLDYATMSQLRSTLSADTASLGLAVVLPNGVGPTGLRVVIGRGGINRWTIPLTHFKSPSSAPSVANLPAGSTFYWYAPLSVGPQPLGTFLNGDVFYVQQAGHDAVVVGPYKEGTVGENALSYDVNAKVAAASEAAALANEEIDAVGITATYGNWETAQHETVTSFNNQGYGIYFATAAEMANTNPAKAALLERDFVVERSLPTNTSVTPLVRVPRGTDVAAVRLLETLASNDSEVGTLPTSTQSWALWTSDDHYQVYRLEVTATHANVVEVQNTVHDFALQLATSTFTFKVDADHLAQDVLGRLLAEGSDANKLSSILNHLVHGYHGGPSSDDYRVIISDSRRNNRAASSDNLNGVNSGQFRSSESGIARGPFYVYLRVPADRHNAEVEQTSSFIVWNRNTHAVIRAQGLTATGRRDRDWETSNAILPKYATNINGFDYYEMGPFNLTAGTNFGVEFGRFHDITTTEDGVQPARAEQLTLSNLSSGSTDVELPPTANSIKASDPYEGTAVILSGISGNDFTVAKGAYTIEVHGEWDANSIDSPIWAVLRRASDDKPLFTSTLAQVIHTANISVPLVMHADFADDTAVNVQINRVSGNSISGSSITFKAIRR